jgi:penicillin-binding protein 1A
LCHPANKKNSLSEKTTAPGCARLFGVCRWICQAAFANALTRIRKELTLPSNKNKEFGPLEKKIDKSLLTFVVPKKALPFWMRVISWCASCLLLWVVIGALGITAIYALVKDQVPALPELNQYNPPATTRVYGQTGILLGEFAVERRDVVPAEMIPRQLVSALIASEDDNFFNHGGIDLLGIFRAALKNIKAGRIVQGGSTITQQVAKSLIGREKTFTRKFKEAILARRLESKFTKEQILYLYLNQIYLGHGSYGVQAAALNYFHKNVWELSLPEIATLAGLPQAPSDYDPVLTPAAALERRNYVLSRMASEKAITHAEEQTANTSPLFAYPIQDFFRIRSPYFTEEVRRQLLQAFTAEGLYEGGLTVETGLDVDWQKAAEEVAYERLRALDLRLGYRGPLLHLEGEDKKNDLLSKLDQHMKDFSALPENKPLLAVVQKVDESGAEVALSTKLRGILPTLGLRWARKPDPTSAPTPITDARKVLKAGDVILVRKTRADALLERQPPSANTTLPEGVLLFSLDQIPNVQTALVSLEPSWGYVRTILGGYNFEDSEFNRVMQACRQPGSSFKPIFYSLAIENDKITPATVFIDSPEVYDDPENEKRWKPDNFDSDSKGMVTVHMALVQSMNRVAIKVLKACGDDEGKAIHAVIDWAKKLGFSTPFKEELGLALGSSCVKPWDLANAYAIFNQGGRKPKLNFIRKVTDRFGRVLINNTAPQDPFQTWDEKFDRAYDRVSTQLPRILSPQANFIITHLLQAVATTGTAYLVHQLGKPAAGKTGTTNDSTDAWFVGFTHDVVTGFWIGHDSPTDPLGPYETGATCAVPIWLKYMQRTLADRPQAEFDVPPGITFARIDTKTGLLARPDTLNSVLEAFKEGQEPKEYVPAKDVAPSGQFFKVDRLY